MSSSTNLTTRKNRHSLRNVFFLIITFFFVCDVLLVSIILLNFIIRFSLQAEIRKYKTWNINIWKYIWHIWKYTSFIWGRPVNTMQWSHYCFVIWKIFKETRKFLRDRSIPDEAGAILIKRFEKLNWKIVVFSLFNIIIY